MNSAQISFAISVALSLIAAANDPPGAETAAITPFVLPSVEERYVSEIAKTSAAIAKAESEALRAKKVAAEARLKAYKDKLVEITKTGDFNKAQQVKARIDQLESESASDTQAKPEKSNKKQRPKDTVKFGGHTYALIKEPTTWHIAKRRCEEMGGHLVVIQSSIERDFIVKLIDGDGVTAWVGASDEETEGEWYWVTGDRVTIPGTFDNYRGVQNHLAWFKPNSRFEDFEGDCRYSFVCEFDN